MHYVYILKSVSFSKKFYVGQTKDLKKRLKHHNSGKVDHTKKYLPWEIETYIAFSSEEAARSFEKYPKEGSGHAFMKKRLINNYNNKDNL